MTFPVLGLEVQLHQPPSQVMKLCCRHGRYIHLKLAMQFACAFLCLSAFAAGRNTCAAFPLRGVSSATAPASCSREREPDVAVGSVVACDGVNHALTCHSTSDSLVLAANKTASSIAGRPSDGPRFHRTMTAVTFSFARRVDARTSGSLRSNSDVSLYERLAVTQLHVSGMLRTIWPSLHRMCCSIQNTLSRARW